MSAAAPGEIVGLLPAAGRGSRLGPIPCSKEIMPLGFQPAPGQPGQPWRPVTALDLHLRAMAQAGVRRVAIVISESKADIVRYIGDGGRYGLATAYLYQSQLRGMPFALDLARAWAGGATTLFSMPDTLIMPQQTMAELMAAHLRQANDVTLGLFETTTPHKFGMVELDANGAVSRFVDKPARSALRLMWGFAAWSPRFSAFMGEHLARYAGAGECVLSDVFAAALAAGLAIRPHVFTTARYRDIGTPEDFQDVVFELAHQAEEQRR